MKHRYLDYLPYIMIDKSRIFVATPSYDFYQEQGAKPSYIQLSSSIPILHHIAMNRTEEQEVVARKIVEQQFTSRGCHRCPLFKGARGR